MNEWDDEHNSCDAPEEAQENDVLWSGLPKEFLTTREREDFYIELVKFLFATDAMTDNFPCLVINSKLFPVDLYLLYTEVIKMGRFVQMDQRGWASIKKLLWPDLPQSAAQADIYLKQLYLKFLYAYEQRSFEAPTPLPEMEQLQSRTKKRKNLSNNGTSAPRRRGRSVMDQPDNSPKKRTSESSLSPRSSASPLALISKSVTDDSIEDITLPMFMEKLEKRIVNFETSISARLDNIENSLGRKIEGIRSHLGFMNTEQGKHYKETRQQLSALRRENDKRGELIAKGLNLLISDNFRD